MNPPHSLQRVVDQLAAGIYPSVVYQDIQAATAVDRVSNSLLPRLFTGDILSAKKGSRVFYQPPENRKRSGIALLKSYGF
jgi:hypothetical protein